MSEIGYVYILSPKDINIPLSKIGMTTRTPHERCAEINKSSTGDLLWQVSYHVYVNNCQGVESLLHNELSKLRQRGREFFQIESRDAHEKLISLLKDNNTLRILDQPDILNIKSPVKSKHAHRFLKGPCAVKHEQLDDIYQVFRNRLGVEGKTFGQTGRSVVGLSDNNAGIQWNLAVWQDTGNITLGVNLEGMKYNDWPISRFILKELESPSIESLKISEFDIESIEVGFTRDAWQMASRPNINERSLIHSNCSLPSWNNSMWIETLLEAKACLRYDGATVGRAVQMVTINKKNGTSEIKNMDVSPHLSFKTIFFNMSDRHREDIKLALEAAFQRLDHVYAWVSARAL